MLFDKKYPAIVLSQAHMLTFHYLQEGLRFILPNEMERILHMIMDSSRGNDDGHGSKYLSTEYDISILLQNGKVLPVTAHIQVHIYKGQWTAGLGGERRIVFIFKTKEKGHVEFSFDVDCRNGKFHYCHIWKCRPNGNIEVLMGVEDPDGANLQIVKKLFLEG